MLPLTRYNSVFLDTSPFIYYIEEDARYLSLVDRIFGRIAEGYLEGISSCITLLEVLVKPLEKADSGMAEKYRNFLLHSENFNLFPLDEYIAQEAARMKAEYRVKTPDAIQLATAHLKGAELFITNDKGLPRNIREIEIFFLEDHIEDKLH